MKKIALVGVIVSLAFTSEARADLVFHYNWLGQKCSDIDASDWTVWKPEDFVATEVTRRGLLFLQATGQWNSISSVERVVTPHLTTGAVEIIFDLWSQNSNVNVNAHYDVPLVGLGFEVLERVIGVSVLGAGNWAICSNRYEDPDDPMGPTRSRCPVDDNGTYSSVRPIRVRCSWDGGVDSTVKVDYALLDENTGEFLNPGNPWQPVPANDNLTDGPPNFAGDLDLDLNRPAPEDPPFRLGFTVLGESTWGMLEVYDTVGNDGTLPAPGNVTGTRPNPLPVNGLQPGGACTLPGGACMDLSAADCTAASGIYQGDGTSCMTGACQLAGGAGACEVLSSGACEAQGGTYDGDGTACPVVPASGLDYHYSWVGQTEIDAADWTVGAGFTDPGANGVADERLLLLDTDGLSATGWRSVVSTEEVVRPHPTTGAVEIIVDMWSQNALPNFGALYSNVRPDQGFGGPDHALSLTFRGPMADWALCVNGKCKEDFTPAFGNYAGSDLPVRLRYSSSGVPGSRYSLDFRRLDANTGQFIGDWTPDPANNCNNVPDICSTPGGSPNIDEDLNLDLCDPDGPPFYFGFTVMGTSRWGMVEVYNTTGNDGTIPAPGNLNGEQADPPPLNGFQVPRGACEIPGGAGSGTCEILTEAACDAQTGTYGGDGTVCPGGAQLPGNANQDAALDLSDVVTVLGFLFQGNPSSLPCTTDAANEAFLDVNTDTAIDLSDAIFLLAFLFQGGPQPDQGDVCIPIVDCPPNPACP